MYKFIDLFCGIGGFRVALEKNGMECVFSSDIDPYVQDIYEKNFGEKPYGDITEIPERKIPQHDILCAGFPCQPFSISGKMENFNDDRGRLFYEIVRIAEYHKPLVLLLENVKNIVSMNNGEIIKTIQQKLDEIGYEVHMHVLNASNFGIPQSRERVYFVCLKKDIGSKEKLRYVKPKDIFKKIYLKDIMEEIVDDTLYINRDDIQFNTNNSINNDEYALKPIKIGIVGKGGQGERIYSTKGHAITLSAFGGGVGARTGLYLDKKGVRRLSLTEGKRVMGFPDSHIISSGLRGYQQLGNAVIPTMIEHVYECIKVVNL